MSLSGAKPSHIGLWNNDMVKTLLLKLVSCILILVGDVQTADGVLAAIEGITPCRLTSTFSSL